MFWSKILSTFLLTPSVLHYAASANEQQRRGSSRALRSRNSIENLLNVLLMRVEELEESNRKLQERSHGFKTRIDALEGKIHEREMGSWSRYLQATDNSMLPWSDEGCLPKWNSQTGYCEYTYPVRFNDTVNFSSNATFDNHVEFENDVHFFNNVVIEGPDNFAYDMTNPDENVNVIHFNVKKNVAVLFEQDLQMDFDVETKFQKDVIVALSSDDVVDQYHRGRMDRRNLVSSNGQPKVYFAGDVQFLDGDITIERDADFIVDGRLQVKNGALFQVEGDLTVGQKLTVNGLLDAKANANVGSTLNVGTTSTGMSGGNLNVGGTITAGGQANLNGGAAIAGPTTVSDKLTVTANGLEVTGPTTLNGEVDIAGLTTVNDKLTVAANGLDITGPTTLNDKLSVTANGVDILGLTTMRNKLVVESGGADFIGNVHVVGNIEATGTITDGSGGSDGGDNNATDEADNVVVVTNAPDIATNAPDVVSNIQDNIDNSPLRDDDIVASTSTTSRAGGN